MSKRVRRRGGHLRSQASLPLKECPNFPQGAPSGQPIEPPIGKLTMELCDEIAAAKTAITDIRFQLRAKSDEATRVDEERRLFVQSILASSQQIEHLTKHFKSETRDANLQRALQRWIEPVARLASHLAQEALRMDDVEFDCSEALAAPGESAEQLEFKLHQIKQTANSLRRQGASKSSKNTSDIPRSASFTPESTNV